VLFGTARSPHATTLYSLYAAHIATLVWTIAQGNEPRRNVIVGLALKGKDGGDNMFGIDEEDRSTFKEIMAMIVDLTTTSKRQTEVETGV
jgi:proteasome assembly chaperone 3